MNMPTNTSSHIWAALVLGLLSAGCERASIVAPEQLAPTLTDIQATIFDTNCAVSGCHAGASPQLGQDLSAGQSFSNIVGVQSVERSNLARIEPGDPENSYLFKKLRGDADIVGAQMPLGRAALSQEQIDLVRDWILDGALDN